MIRLHITAEGQTELAFARSVLAPHLADFDVFVQSDDFSNSSQVSSIETV